MDTGLGINKDSSILYLCGLGIQHEKIQQELDPLFQMSIFMPSFPAGTSCGSSIPKAQHRAQDSARAVQRKPTETLHQKAPLQHLEWPLHMLVGDWCPETELVC